MIDAIAMAPETFGSLDDLEGTSDEDALTVSGTVADAQGRALSGVLIDMSAPPRGPTLATAVTGADGSYAIAGCLVDRSWQLNPSRAGCRFTPTLARLDHVIANRRVNFTGLGEACAGGGGVVRNVAPIDPGPRPGPPGAGGPPLLGRPRADQRQAAAIACIPDLAPPMLLLCEDAFIRFQEVDSVSGAIRGEDGAGLGPTFNGNSCAMCHSQPAVLGSSPAPFSPQKPVANPQVALAVLDGARNEVPPFVTESGPVRVVRFRSDGEVHDLYTIAGRVDAHGCGQHQPDFANNLRNDNVRSRIPLALFGLGLIEAVPDATLRANLAASTNAALGIGGTFNGLGNDRAIARFGRKAQTKSLLAFAGEAYNVEQGVTNEIFPEERNAAPGCSFNGVPEDKTDPMRTGTVSDANSDVQNFAIAMRLSAAPRPALPPGPTQASVDHGAALFETVGCGHCHTPTLTTATSNLDAALSNVQIHPFSDFAIHRMGVKLADDIVQGDAGPDQFRTTPLWGVGQRLFFLHDGRTTDIVDAIQAHASAGSEANVVIGKFNQLLVDDQQDIVNFLRSL